MDNINRDFTYSLTDRLLTEKSNSKSLDLDLKSTYDLVKIFSEEDLEPQRAVARVLPDITNAIDKIVAK